MTSIDQMLRNRINKINVRLRQIKRLDMDYGLDVIGQSAFSNIKAMEILEVEAHKLRRKKAWYRLILSIISIRL